MISPLLTNGFFKAKQKICLCQSLTCVAAFQTLAVGVKESKEPVGATSAPAGRPTSLRHLIRQVKFLVFCALKKMVDPWGLEPQTSTVSKMRSNRKIALPALLFRLLLLRKGSEMAWFW